MADNPRSSVENLVGSAVETVITNPIQSATAAISDTGFGKALRSIGLLPGAVPQGGAGFTAANWGSQTDLDWRVRLSIPSTFKTSPLLQPLLETNGFMFPYTPQIILEHAANYNSLHPTHSNYAFPAYQNSQVNAMTIIGDFFVENEQDGAYWIAAVHYLRSITKMAYGASSNAGSPPPVVKLNGYGDFIFRDVPVVITNFTIDLPQDVDYIQTGLKGVTVKRGELVGDFDDGRRAGVSWVPTQSLITVTVQPIYSRREIEGFSLQKYVNGDYISSGKGFI